MSSKSLRLIPEEGGKPLRLIPDEGGKPLQLIPEEEPKEETKEEPRADKDAYFRQALATFPDLLTGVPVLAGLAGAGIETIGRKFTTDDDIVTAFKKSLSTGIDKDLLDLGVSGRLKTNELLGIREPENTGEMLARMALMAIPNPVTWGSKGATLAANLLTPLVKVAPKAGTAAAGLVGKGQALKAMVTNPKAFVTKPNVARLGTQFGLGLAIDQAARALSDAPTIYSDLTGTPPEGKKPLRLIPDGEGLAMLPDPLRDMHDQLKDEETERTAKKTTLGIAIALGTIAALAWRKRLNATKLLPSEFAPAGQGVTPEGFHQSAGQYVHSNFVDNATFLRSVAKDIKDPVSGNQVISEDHIDQLVDAVFADSVGKARRIGIDGKLPATDTTPGIEIPSLRNLAIKIAELDEGSRKVFIDGLVARRELVQRLRTTMAKVAKADPDDYEAQRLSDASRGSTTGEIQAFLRDRDIDLVKTGLFDNNYPGAKGIPKARETDAVQRAVDAVENNPTLRDIMLEYGKITEGLLEFAVKRKVLTPELKATWQREFTIYGSAIYIPGRELNAIDRGRWYERLGAAMGVGTTKQTEMQGLGQWMSGLADEGTGIKNPLGPVDSISEYLYHVIDHTDRSVGQWNIYSALTGVDDLGRFRAGHPGSRIAEFIGIHDPTGPDAGNLRKAITSDSPTINKMFNLEDKATFLGKDSANMDRVTFVQRNGKEYMFFNHDPAFKMLMDFKPRVLSNINKVGRVFKNIFTATTTRLPFFTPISFGYTTQQGWTNAIASGAKFTPIDAFKGAWAGVSEGIADEIAVQIGHSLRMETGLSSAFPSLARTIEKRMKAVVERSLLNGIQSQQGVSMTSVAASDKAPNILNMVKQVAPMYQDGFSGLSSLWRMYNITNLAIHEGAATGAMLRAIKAIPDPSPSQIRRAGRTGKTLIGDVRRLGGSNLATTFNAWVPFSGAMIQSWNSVGSAFRKGFKENPTRAFAALSVPMIPAIMEAVNNSLQGPEQNHYYWNVLSTEQRNNNIVIGIPGLPPERSWLIPVSPEWTLIRGMGIEMVDAITGASRGEHMPSGQAQENGAHFMAGLVRVFDIPVPPFIQALFASQGYNLRIGPQYHNNQVQFPISVRELTQGERISGDKGRSRYVDAAVDTEVEGIVRSLTGAVGSTLLAVAEVFRQGSSEDLGTGVEMGFDQLLAGIRGQTRYLSPLYQNNLHPNANNEIADSNRVKQAGVTKLSESYNTARTRGAVISLDAPIPFEGNAVQPTDDPVVIIAGQALDAVKHGIAQYKKWIGYQRKQIQSLRSSTRTLQGVPLSVDGRQRLMDEHELTITGLNAKQSMMFSYYEDIISDMISKRLGLEDGYEFSFDDYRARPNLGEGLILKAPRKLLQTSQ